VNALIKMSKIQSRHQIDISRVYKFLDLIEFRREAFSQSFLLLIYFLFHSVDLHLLFTLKILAFDVLASHELFHRSHLLRKTGNVSSLVLSPSLILAVSFLDSDHRGLLLFEYLELVFVVEVELFLEQEQLFLKLVY
jgi:hypothetical protein